MKPETSEYLQKLLKIRWYKIDWNLDFIYRDSESILSACDDLGFDELKKEFENDLK